MPRHRHPTLQEAQQADVDEGVAPWAAPDALRPLSVRLVGHAKRWTKRAAAITGLVTGLSTLAGSVVRFVQWVRSPTVAPAETPKTGTPTVATDFVDEPRAGPDGSDPAKQR